MKNVVFLGYDVNLGVTFHFVDWIKAIYDLSKNQLNLFYITLKKEQYSGLLERLEEISPHLIMIDHNKDLGKLNIFEKADLVHCHGMRQISIVEQIRKERNLSFKILVTMHSYRHGSWYRPFYSNMISLLYLNKVESIHFVSQQSKREFLSWNFLYLNTNISKVFPLGVKKERFYDSVNINELPFYGDLTSCKKNMIYLADMIPRKQHLWLVKSLKNILIEEDARLWLFGQGKLLEKVRNFVIDNGLDKNVFFPGRIDGKYIPEILKKMQLAVCSSKSETMGHVIMEPMFAGIPVVTFDVGIASSVIRDYVTGFIVKGKSEAENFRNAIMFLLRNDEVRIQMGENARSFANKWLTWKVTAENCLNLYLGMLS